jgi:hypothetical protein
MLMKEIKLYNVLFPIWMLLFLPPVVFITLLGNFIIDSLVVIGIFAVFKLSTRQMEVKSFYKRSVLRVWLFGFTADMIGACCLLGLDIYADLLGIPYEIISAVSYDPFGHPASFAIVAFAMLISGFLIFIFNYRFTFARQIEDKGLRFKTAMTVAVVTIPWTFLIPMRWFYNGF